MIILRQKSYGLTNDGGGTSSIDFYKDPTVKAQYINALNKYKAAGGNSGTGQSFEEFKKTFFTGQNLSEQKSNMVNDKSTYRGASLRQGTTQSGKPVTVDNRFASRDNSIKAQQANYRVNQQKKVQQAFNKGQQQGAQSVGIKQGALNTWNSLSRNQQIGVGVGAGVVALGTTALIANNIRKRKEAEEDLERERRRR